MLITVDSQTATRLLRIYGIKAPVKDERSYAHDDGGIPITIDGVADPECGVCIRLKIGGKRSLRTVPVSESDADSLIREFHADHVLGEDAKADRTLVNLVMKCSKLIAHGSIDELHLVLYVTREGYRTHGIYMLRTRNVSRGRPARPQIRGSGAAIRSS